MHIRKFRHIQTCTGIMHVELEPRNHGRKRKKRPSKAGHSEMDSGACNHYYPVCYLYPSSSSSSPSSSSVRRYSYKRLTKERTRVRLTIREVKGQRSKGKGQMKDHEG